MRRVRGNGGFPYPALKIQYRDSFHSAQSQNFGILEFWTLGSPSPKWSVQVFSQEVNQEFWKSGILDVWKSKGLVLLSLRKKFKLLKFWNFGSLLYIL